jgi:hypothetical protein
MMKGLARFGVLAILLAFSNPGFAARKIYLAIGIDRYQDSFWGDLRYSSKDALDMAKAFEKDFDGGTVLTSAQNPDGWVKTSDILTALERLHKENLSEDDQVVIYISAHGTIARSLGEGRRVLEKYLVTSDTDSVAPQLNGLAHAKLMSHFQKLPSRRKVLIIDSCFSGSGKSRLTQKILDLLSHQKGRDLEDLSSPIEGSIILSASAWGEEAVESAALKNSLYTYHLLKGFDSDLNADGAVSITEAHAYAARKVIEETEGKQHPTAHIEVVGQDPIIVRGKAGKTKGSPLIFAYEQLMRKLTVELNGKPLANLSKGGDTVPAGTHTLTIRDHSGKLILEKAISLEHGHEYSLSRFLEYNPSWAVRVGLQSLWLPQQALKEKILPTPLLGYAMDVRKEDLSPKVYGQISLFHAQKNVDIQSSGIKVPEDLRWTEASAHIGRIWNGSDLRRSGSKRDPDYYLGMDAGLGIVSMQRTLLHPSYEDPRQAHISPMAQMAVEAGWENIDRNFVLSLRLGNGVMQGTQQAAYPRQWSVIKATLLLGLTF